MTRLQLYGVLALAFVAGLLGLVNYGQRLERRAAELRDLRGAAKATERMNDAETGGGMDDSARTDWLRAFAKRNRRP
jgi:hypothetical protein